MGEEYVGMEDVVSCWRGKYGYGKCLPVGEKDMDIFKAKSILGDKKIVGISCYNNIKNALHAEKHGATYVSFGAVYKTTTKTNAEWGVLMHPEK